MNQGMANTQTSTGYIDLEAVGGRQPILSEYLERYPEQKGIIYPNCENNFMGKSSEEAMICLTELRTHTNGRLIAYTFFVKYNCSLQFSFIE